MKSFDSMFSNIGFFTALDILAVAFIIYSCITLLRGSIAVHILTGYVSIYIIYLVVKVLDMTLLTAILHTFFQIGLIALLIMFQQEIRKMFLTVGKKFKHFRSIYFKRYFNQQRILEEEIERNVLIPIIEACKVLKETRTGALIIFAKNDDEEHVYRNGEEINAYISKRIIESIFNKYSPLHDGAMIISKGKIQAAGCILPLTENHDLPAFMGLRHRAALGVAESASVSALVVSEETGNLAYAKDGKIITHVSVLELERFLRRDLAEE